MGSGHIALFFQFDEDGNYRVAQTVLTNLQDSPTNLGQFKLEGGMLTFTTSDESPMCAGKSGTYEVYLLEEGRISFSLVEDECIIRSDTSYPSLEPLSP